MARQTSVFLVVLAVAACLALPFAAAQTPSFAYVSTASHPSTDCSGDPTVVVTTLISGSSCTDPAVASTLGTCAANGTASTIKVCSSDVEQKPMFPAGTTGLYGAGVTYVGSVCEGNFDMAAFRDGLCLPLTPTGFRGFGQVNCASSIMNLYTDAACTEPRADGTNLPLNSTCTSIIGGGYRWQGSCVRAESAMTTGLAPTTTGAAATTTAAPLTSSRPSSGQREGANAIVALMVVLTGFVIFV